MHIVLIEDSIGLIDNNDDNDKNERKINQIAAIIAGMHQTTLWYTQPVRSHNT